MQLIAIDVGSQGSGQGIRRSALRRRIDVWSEEGRDSLPPRRQRLRQDDRVQNVNRAKLRHVG